MNVLNIRDADFSALLELAECRFQAWQLKEHRPDMERRLRDLENQCLTMAGRATKVLEIYRDLLEKEARKRISFYAELAHESGCPEMFSKVRLGELRDLIIHSAEVAVAARKQQIQLEARMAGCPEYALPVAGRYVEVLNPTRNAVNTELRTLAAEGRMLGSHTVGATSPVPRQDLPAPVAKVGGLGSPSIPLPRNVSGAINYQFPPDFPSASRDTIKREELSAAREFNASRPRLSREREVLAALVECAMRPTLAYSREAHKLGWGAARIDKELRYFVLRTQAWVGLTTLGGHLSPEVQKAFEQSDMWKQCQAAAEPNPEYPDGAADSDESKYQVISRIASLVGDSDISQTSDKAGQATDSSRPGGSATNSARQRKPGSRGPQADEQGHLRTFELLSCFDWESDLARAYKLLDSPTDGGPPVTVSRKWRVQDGVESWADAGEKIGLSARFRENIQISTIQ